MKILITGADRLTGGFLARALRNDHHVTLTGSGGAANEAAAGLDYRAADLRDPNEVAGLVKGLDAVIHASVFDPKPLLGPTSEQDRLDISSRGTYVLFQESRKAGVDRVVLLSSLDLLDRYPEKYVLDERWQPKPAADAESLAPYLAEMVAREFVLETGLRAICLRFGTIGQAEGTIEEEAIEAVKRSLQLEFTDSGYRWQLFHVCSSDRFPSVDADRVLQLHGEAK